VGRPLDDLALYELALEMGVNPAEVEDWDCYHISRLQLVLRARNEAALSAYQPQGRRRGASK
jgi:hypothetical protein